MPVSPILYPNSILSFVGLIFHVCAHHLIAECSVYEQQCGPELVVKVNRHVFAIFLVALSVDTTYRIPSI